MDQNKPQPLRTITYRQVPDFLRRQLASDFRSSQPTMVDPNQFEGEIQPFAQRLNTTLQDLQRREENARQEAARAQELLQRNVEQGFMGAEQARDSRREGLRQANQETQLQNRMRLRAMGGMPGSALQEIQSRADRELNRNIAGVDADFTNRLNELENKAFEQMGGLESELRNRLSGIDEQRTMSLRELDQIRAQAREQARARALQAQMMGGFMGGDMGGMQQGGSVLGADTMAQGPAGEVESNLAEQNVQAQQAVANAARARLADPNDIAQRDPAIKAELQRIANNQMATYQMGLREGANVINRGTGWNEQAQFGSNLGQDLRRRWLDLTNQPGGYYNFGTPRQSMPQAPLSGQTSRPQNRSL